MNTLISRWWQAGKQTLSFPELQSELVHRTGNTGVCFSGGGTRAQSAALGQLRALHELGLLPQIRYLSSVSGGSWACAPFIWSQVGNDHSLLGPVTAPEALSLEGLEQDIPVGQVLATATTNLNRVAKGKLGKFPLDRIWTESVGQVYLQPFGLHDSDVPAMLARDPEQVARIRADNPSLAEQPFHTPRDPERLPYLVINGCGIGPSDLAPFSEEDPVSFELTPGYGGNPQLRHQLFFSQDGRWAEAQLGGGYLESFVLGSPKRVGATSDGGVTVSAPGRPYTLADGVGTSSAAFAGLTAGSELFGRAVHLNPMLMVWPMGDHHDSAAPTHGELFAMGDGGVLENYGLLTLLRRKVQRVVVFVNTATPLDTDYDSAASVPTSDQVDAFLPPLFGFRIKSLGVALMNNQVFDGADFVTVIEGLQAATRAGGPVHFETTHRVRENTFWGIEGGWEVRVMWCYLGRNPSWEANLQEDVADAIERGQRRVFAGEFENFPHYKTAGQDSLADVHLSNAQARLLSELTCGTTLQDGDRLSALLGAETDGDKG